MKLKKLLLVLAAAAALMLLASCDMKTTITADKSFCGERVMECTVYKNELNSEYVSGTAADIEKALRAELPEDELTLECKKNRDGSYKYTFTLSFENYDDYLTKVTNLLGEEPQVKYNYSGTPFSRGFLLKEDFSSADLLGWAKEAIKNAGIFKRFEYAELNFTSTTAEINGKKLKTTDKTNKTVSVSMSEETKLDKIDISTVKKDFYNYQRTVEYVFPQSAVDFVGQSDFEKYLKALKPEGGTVDINYPAEGSDETTVTAKVEFTTDAENLGEYTNIALGAKNSVARYTFLEDGLTAFTGRWELYEYIDLSAWKSVKGNLLGPVNIWYKTEDGSRLTSDCKATVGIAALGGTVTNNGRIIEYNNLTEDILRINLYAEYNFSLERVKISVAENSTNKFTKRYTFIYSTPEDAAYAPEFTTSYFKVNNCSGCALFTSDITEEGYGRLVIESSGTAKKITEATDKLFGEGNGITQQFDEKSKFTLTLENYITDNNNLTEFLQKGNYGGTIAYSLRPYAGNSIYNAEIRSADGSVTENKDSEISADGKMTAEVSQYEFSCSYKSLGDNKWIVVIFIAAGVILVAGIIVIMSGSGKSSRSKNKKKNKL